MTIFSVFLLLGGLSFFLFGMSAMSNGLEKIAGGKLETALKKLTSNPFKSILLGGGITIAIQSSSAMTVMLVGLVNSGIMELGQTISVIMGSNIGTTFTTWILSLQGLNAKDNVFLELLKPENFSPLAGFFGIVMITFCKKEKKKDIGSILVGFSILMYGMVMMSQACEPLKESVRFQQLLTVFKNPVVGVLVGTLFTALIQSSAASIGILQTLSGKTPITYSMGIPIILGQNIGTCITAVLACFGVNKDAKRVAAVHTIIKILGTIIFLVLYFVADAIFRFKFSDTNMNPYGIALVHTVFNVLNTIVLLPFSKQLEKLSRVVIKDNEKDEAQSYTLLDDRLLTTPAFAISEARALTEKMAVMAKENLIESLDMVLNYDKKLCEKIIAEEDIVDDYEDKLGTYLVKVSGMALKNEDAADVSKLLHCIGDFERISDHSVNLVQVAEEMQEKKISFSSEAIEEIKIMMSAVSEILDITIKSFITADVKLASRVEPLEEVIDGLRMDLKNRHILRLQEEKCTIELGFIFSDLLTNLERVSDHCSNIAVCLIQLQKDIFDTHEYITNLKENDVEFQKMCDIYVEKYKLPELVK